MDFLNYNAVVIDNIAMLPSIENLPGFEARAAFTVNSATVFREDVDIMPTIVGYTLSYIPWGGDNPQVSDQMGDNQMPFDMLVLVEFLAPQATSRLAPPVFRNEKKASGYIF